MLVNLIIVILILFLVCLFSTENFYAVQNAQTLGLGCGVTNVIGVKGTIVGDATITKGNKTCTPTTAKPTPPVAQVPLSPQELKLLNDKSNAILTALSKKNITNKKDLLNLMATDKPNTINIDNINKKIDNIIIAVKQIKKLPVDNTNNAVKLDINVINDKINTILKIYGKTIATESKIIIDKLASKFDTLLDLISK